jgi:alpha-beta hydrolase superfamily lysophospholipase
MYADAMGNLAGAGIAVAALDLRGHGRSDGPRGDAPSYEQLLDDVGLLLREAQRLFGQGVPRFLFGNSQGGSLVLNYALRRRPVVSGVIASSPWLRLAFRLPPWVAALARFLRVVRPDYCLTQKDPKLLPDMVGRGCPKPRDEMVHRTISPRTFFESRDAGDWALRNAAAFPSPLLLIHGDQDRVTSIEASEQFAARAPGDVTFIAVPGLRHLIHVEQIEEEVFSRVISWIGARV